MQILSVQIPRSKHLHSFQWITLSTYNKFCILSEQTRFAHDAINCFISISAQAEFVILLFFLSWFYYNGFLFQVTINNDLISLQRCPLRSHIYIDSSVTILICLLKWVSISFIFIYFFVQEISVSVLLVLVQIWMFQLAFHFSTLRFVI